MDSRTITTATNAVANLIEQNISNIEKIHTQIKTRRFIGVNAAVLVGILIIAGLCSLSFVFATDNYLLYILISCLIIIGLLIFLTNKYKENNFPLLHKAILWLLSIFIQVLAFACLLLTRIEYRLWSFVLINVLYAIAAIGWIILLYKFSKPFSDAVVQKYFFKNHYASILLLSGLTVEGKLITITGKGDYILYSEATRVEILVKSNAVATVKIDTRDIILSQ